MPGHYSDITLGDIEKVINNDSIKLRVEYLNAHNIFSRQEVKEIWNFLCVIFLNSGTYWCNYCALRDKSMKFCTDTH